MSAEDFYAILGVSRDADNQTIRQAFKKLALTHHPDKVCESERPEAEIQFKIISEAYEVLSNEESRMMYDAQSQFDGSTNWQDFYAPPQDDFFGFGYGGGGSQFYSEPPPNYSKRTEDVVFEVELTLEDVFKGKMLKLSSQRQVLCRRCDGTGGRRGAKKRTCHSCKGCGTIKRSILVGPGLVATSTVECPVCHGDGQVFRDKDLCPRCKGKKTQEVKTLIEVYVPKGVKNRHRIVIEGQSDESPGKVAGDLIIMILVNSEHPTFRREGADLYATAEITLKEALTGFSRPLLTHLDGRKLQPTVARGSILKPGSILKIPGEGLITENVSAGTETMGDLYIQVDVVFPSIIDEHILDKLATLLTPDDDEHDSDRSDETLDEGSEFVRNAKHSSSSSSNLDSKASSAEPAYCGSGIDIEHEIITEAELPQYEDDANDEQDPNTASSEQEKAQNDFGGWRHFGAEPHTAEPGCAQM